jgi:acetolactate synthase regulatory subunit
MEDVYPNESIQRESALCYISIVAPNIIGILNRISSLMRRKRYNMEEVSVAFDQDNMAHFLIAIDSNEHDIEQVMNQLDKLHDVVSVENVSDRTDKLFYAIYVDSTEKHVFNAFPFPPVDVVKLEEGFKGVFMVNLEKIGIFSQYLRASNLSYVKRILSLVG